MSVTLFMMGGLSVLFFYHFKSNNLVSEFNIQQFTDDVKPVCVTIIHKAIYLYSLCQMQFFKAKQYICDDKIVHNSGDESMEIFHNNSLVFAQTRTNITDYKCIYDLITTSHLVYDLAIYTKANNHKICYNKISDKTDYKYELSDIQFLSIIVTYNDTHYAVKLKDYNYNYYIVNNVINKTFLKYYLKSVLNIVDIDNEFTYKLDIVDHNVCEHHLETNDSIIIQKNGYKIENGHASIDIPVVSYDYVTK